MPWQITLSDKPVYDAVRERRNALRIGLTVPGIAQANCFLLPLGAAHGRGWVCMVRKDIDALDKDKLHTLVFDDGKGNRVRLTDLVFVKATSLTPGEQGDPKAAYLVELADRRWLCHNPYYAHTLNQQYNVPHPVSDLSTQLSFYGHSQGTWTWETLGADLWGKLGSKLGAWPGLPAGLAPNAKPVGFTFVGVSCWQALCHVLDRLGCAVGLDWPEGKFSVAQVGAPDGSFQALQAAARKVLLYDADVIEGGRARFPEKVRVYFNRLDEHAGSPEASEWLGEPVYSVALATGLAKAEAGVEHALWDDLVAVFDVIGVIKAQSATDCLARAQDRLAAYLKVLRDGGTMLYQVYAAAVGFRPGPLVKGVAWRQDRRGGIVTEIVRHPFHLLRAGDDGRWEACDAVGKSVTMQPPDFGPSFPQWPLLLELVEVQGGSTNGVYSGAVQVVNPGSVPPGIADRDLVWLFDGSPSV